MRTRAVLLIYGEGGHRAQMARLHSRVSPYLAAGNFESVGLCDSNDTIIGFTNYSQSRLRDKHSHIRTLLSLPRSLLGSVKVLLQILTRYRIAGVISTGPGIAILPSLILKIIGVKIVFIETWCRFETTSWTGRIMYRIADRFYIQNPSLQEHYPRAIYGGLL